MLLPTRCLMNTLSQIAESGPSSSKLMSTRILDVGSACIRLGIALPLQSALECLGMNLFDHDFGVLEFFHDVPLPCPICLLCGGDCIPDRRQYTAQKNGIGSLNSGYLPLPVCIDDREGRGVSTALLHGSGKGRAFPFHGQSTPQYLDGGRSPGFPQIGRAHV